MSRTHLYRGGRPARPAAPIVLASAWSGAALLALLAGVPLRGATVLHGAGAALQDRLALLVALGAVLVGLAVTAAELVAGRTRLRGARLTGAVVLALAGGVGSLDASRRTLRPGTPVLEARSAEAAELAVERAPEEPGSERLGWFAAGLGGALLVLAGGVLTLRSGDRAP